jgi:tetratricopeptide (TPR) repeat protein
MYEKLGSNVNNRTAFAAVRSRHCLLVLLGLGLLLGHQWAVAESPALYGQEYVRLGQSSEDDGPRSLPASREEYSDDDKSDYLERIQIQELSGGPYSDSLAEPLSSLGRYYRDQGNYEEALGLYKRALHVVRVNDGLYSERQIPVVRALLDTYRMAGEMQALDERYDYFFRLYGNGYPPFTPLRMRANLEYLRWQREAFGLGLDGDRKFRLVDMYRLNERILKSAAQSTVVGKDSYRRLVLSQIRNLYLLQSEIELPEEGFTSISSRSMQPDQGRDGMHIKQQQLESIRQKSAAKGRSLLQELIARIASSGEAADLASIHLELGDWQQWNGNSHSARQEYSRVIDILEDASDSQLLEQWLGSPAELPVNAAFWQPARRVKDGGRVVLSAEYDVSARGKARNIQVLAARPEDEVFASRLRRKLSATRFRPRFATGEAEAVERVSRKYELIVD